MFLTLTSVGPSGENLTFLHAMTVKIIIRITIDFFIMAKFDEDDYPFISSATKLPNLQVNGNYIYKDNNQIINICNK